MGYISEPGGERPVCCGKAEGKADKGKTSRQAEIWEMLETYADIRDGLEESLQSFQLLYEEIGFAMDEITGELEELDKQLTECSGRLKRFKFRRHNHHETVREEFEIPFL